MSGLKLIQKIILPIDAINVTLYIEKNIKPKKKKIDEIICKTSWPKYDSEKVIDQEKEIAIQVNGKVRDTIKVPNDASKEEHEEKAFASEIIKKWTDGKEIIKVITVPGRIVNIVVK